MDEDTFRLDMVDIAMEITGLERRLDKYAKAVGIVDCEQKEQVRSFTFAVEL